MVEGIFNIWIEESPKAPIKFFDFGEVEAGVRTKRTFWLENITGGYLTNLSFHIDEESVKIIKAPKEFNPDEEKELVLEIKPSLNIRKGLKVPVSVEAKVTFVP